MTLDDDVSALAAHRLEVESWEDMARRQEADDEDMARREWMDRKACESIEAEEARWRGILQAQAADPFMQRVRYRDERMGIDGRLHGSERP